MVMTEQMSRAKGLEFEIMSFIHDTLYTLFRDPYRVLAAAGLEKGQKVLEVGCGPGFFTIPAAKIVGKEGGVCALDINPFAVERVQQKIKRKRVTNVETLLIDAARTDLPDESFDLAFLFGFARHIGQIEKMWVELHRVLKPKGILSVEGRLQPPNHLFMFAKCEGRIYQFKKSEPIV
jgi:ubiquinone/menaquinone biosynthesis C-methylase UbiE